MIVAYFENIRKGNVAPKGEIRMCIIDSVLHKYFLEHPEDWHFVCTRKI